MTPVVTRSCCRPVHDGMISAAEAAAGSIDELPSGALRVHVYAGTDPVSKRRLDLTEVVPPGLVRPSEPEKFGRAC